MNPRVSPSAILPCHAYDQGGDDLHDPRSAGGSTLVRPLLGNQSPVPAKDGVGSDEGRNFGESPSSDRLASYSKSSSLSIGQSEPSSAELLPEDAVLFPEIVDDRVLLARDPSRHRGHEDLPRLEYHRHRAIVVRSAADRQLST